MTGYDRLAALLEPRTAVKADRPDLYAAFAEDSEDVGDMAPGAAIVAFVGMWLAEHWPALAIGAAAGLLAIAIPAMIIAPSLAR